MGMQFIRDLLGLSGLGFPVNNVQDEACPDFETLQIRTTVWRSIPLAMISLCPVLIDAVFWDGKGGLDVSQRS